MSYLDVLLLRPEWQSHAICHGMTEVFFAPAGEREPERLIRLEVARDLCGRCPVRVECEEFGREERYGMWGGLEDGDRAKAREAAGARKAAKCGTSSGYARHRRRDEEPCDDCKKAKQAANAAQRARRQRLNDDLARVRAEREAR